MRLGPTGDDRGVSVEECAVRMAKTGAEIIGSDSQRIFLCFRLGLIIRMAIMSLRVR